MFGGFGQTPQSTASTGGFSFGANTPAGGTAPNTNFTFGATTGTGGAGQGGFSFGTQPATTGAAPSTGFNFGSVKTSGSTGFGTQPAQTSANTTGFSLAPQQTQASSIPTGFSLGTPQTQVSATPAGATTQAQTAPTSGFNFGNVQTQEATGFSFGRTMAATSASTGTTGTTPASGQGGTIFGLKPQGAAATTGTSATTGFTGLTANVPASSSGTLAGLLQTTTTATTSGVSTTATTTAPTGFSLGSTATTSAPSTGFSFGAPASSSATLPGLSFPAISSTVSSSASASTVATTTTSAMGFGIPTSGTAGTTMQKQMTFRQLEDTINKWTTELEEQEKYFLEQATQVNTWDRIVMDNGEKIIQLNKDVEKVKLDQQKLDHELDFVHSQQRELEQLLVPLEKALDSLPPISYQQHADVEREHTYMLAESLDAQLKRMGQDLKEIIERLNSNNSKPDPNDPVQQITKILNAHVVSLMWVDRNSGNLQKRVEEISKQMDIERREQERNFRLAYS